MHKTKMDDGFYPYLVDGAALVGAPGIPALMDLHNAQVPRKLIPFEKIRRVKDRRGYVHFYMHDRYFEQMLTARTKYVDLLKQFDGVITPDCTLERGQAPCLQQTNTYFNRAVGYYLQKQGIPVIANIRWSDESSFEYCFLGVPRKTIVCVSTHGCIKSGREKNCSKPDSRRCFDSLNRRRSLFMDRCRQKYLADMKAIPCSIDIPANLNRRIPVKGGMRDGGL